MKRTLVVAAIAIVLLAVAFAALAPATLFTAYVDRLLRGSAAAIDSDGTVWHGRTIVVAGTTRVPLGWTFEPLPLLLGEARVHVAPADGNAFSPRADVVAASRRIELSGVDVVLPAATVQQWVSRAAMARPGLRADGEVRIATPRLEWTPTVWRGSIDVAWREARLTLDSQRPVDLGELAVRLAAQGDRLAGTIGNQGGDLDVRGDVGVGPDGTASASLLLTPRRADDAALARALAALGTPEGAGWRVSWSSGPR